MALALVLAASPAARADDTWQTLGCQLVQPVVASVDPGAPAPPPDLARLDSRAFANARRVSGRERSGLVTFTFDDGPSPATTPRILAILERYEVPGTFFVVGRRFRGSSRAAQRGVELLREIADRGHAIGNHTTRHQRLTRQSPAAARTAIDDNAEAIAAVLGQEPKLFRPPYGAINRRVRKHLEKRGDTEVLWSIDSHDYQKHRADTLRQRVSRAIVRRGGGVVLFHDTKRWTAKALSGVLDDLEAENCRRLEAGETPILPVSIHYFLHERDGAERPLPPEITAQTHRYRQGLPDRCAARAIDNATAGD